MADPNNIDPENGNQEQQISKEAFDNLSKQVENLNKGIASERNSSKEWQKKYNELSEEIKNIRKGQDNFSVDDDEIVLNPEDERRLKAWAQKQGFVSKAELEAEKQKIQLDSIKTFENQAISEFLEKHPEYDADENWQKVLSEFQLYKQPTSLDGFRKLLNKIHKDLSGENTKDDGRTKEKIENIKKSRLSLGGGNQLGGDSKDAEIDEYQKRYPNLSRDQIVQRLSEIKSLYPKK